MIKQNHTWMGSYGYREGKPSKAQGTVSLRWPPPFQRSRCYTCNHPAHWFQPSSQGRPRPRGFGGAKISQALGIFFEASEKHMWKKNPCPHNVWETKHKKTTLTLQVKLFLKQTPKMCVCVYQVCVFFMGWLYGCGQKGHVWNQCYSKTCKIEDKKGLLHQILPCRYVRPSHTIPSMSWYYIYLQITSPKIIPKKIYRFDMFLTSNFCPKCTRKSLTLATSAHHTFTSLHVASKAGSNWTYPSWQPCKQTFVHNNFGGLSKKIFTKFPTKILQFFKWQGVFF